MPIRAIMFDVHQTLIKKDYGQIAQAHRNATAFLQSEGYDVSLEEIERAWERNRNEAVARLQNGGDDEVEFYGWYRSLLAHAGISEAAAEFIDRFNDAFARSFSSRIEAMPGAKEILQTLRRSYRLAVVSNSLGRNTRWDLQVAGLDEFFRHYYMSSEVGKRKPHPAIFQTALDGLGVGAAEVIMVGDHPREDISGAQQAGIFAVHYAAQGSEPCCEADAVIDDLRQVRAVLEGLSEADAPLP